MKQFKNILYVAEEGMDQTSAMARAVTLAENNQAELTVIDVIPRIPLGLGMADGSQFSTHLQVAMASEHRQGLESLIGPHRQRIKIELDVLTGTAFLEIIRAVLRHRYDRVIKPAENPDFVARLFGSDDRHLLRKCPLKLFLSGSSVLRSRLSPPGSFLLSNSLNNGAGSVGDA
ncbi:hypothetical protein MTYM_01398 [Methylococcales bacterium]|nr:hypothetical protein MTYM_01398 [Methylococcales bacterium]